MRDPVHLFASVFAPVAVATLLGRGSTHACIATVVVAALLVGFGATARIGVGSLGIAIAIGSRHGTHELPIAVALAGILAALLAFSGVERLLRALPRQALNVIGPGLVLGGVAVALRTVLGSAQSARSVGALVGDTIALGLVMSFEASLRRHAPAVSTRLHLVSASLLLPLSFERAARSWLVPLAAGVGLVVALSPLAVPIALAALVVAAVSELAPTRALRLRDVAPVAALAFAIFAYRPAVSALLAIALAVTSSPAESLRTPES